MEERVVQEQLQLVVVVVAPPAIVQMVETVAEPDLAMQRRVPVAAQVGVDTVDMTIPQTPQFKPMPPVPEVVVWDHAEVVQTGPRVVTVSIILLFPREVAVVLVEILEETVIQVIFMVTVATARQLVAVAAVPAHIMTVRRLQ